MFGSSSMSVRLFPASLAVLRIALGALFLMSGWGKLTSAWSATAYLQAASGPFADLFRLMAGSSLVDGLNAWGQLLIGLALIVGVGVRVASVAGVVLMLLYYVAAFTSNTAHGYIDDHIIYALVFIVFMWSSVDRVYGIAPWIKWDVLRKRAPWVSRLLS